MAGTFEQFPYTNYHDLNLDWIIEALKELNDRVTDLEARVTALEEA